VILWIEDLYNFQEWKVLWWIIVVGFILALLSPLKEKNIPIKWKYFVYLLLFLQIIMYISI
jgi:hypothetical protein